MWEAIQANRRRSRLLIGLMGAILVGFGALMGRAFIGPEGLLAGAGMALAVWLIMLAIAFVGGDQIVLMTAGARPIKKEDAPRLWNVVEEMSIASGLGRIPRIYVIDDEMPNAFATGRKKENASVAVTSGLLRRLNRDELQGVVAHEIAHIKNQDVQFMTLALVMVGSIVLLSDMVLRVMWFGGGRRRGSSRGGGQAQAIFLILTLVAAILAPFAARILYFAVSRKREYLADASAAQFTRYPPGLASALEKISGQMGRIQTREMRALAPMYIVSPLKAAGGTGLFSTHPPVRKRVQILRSMGGMVGWAEYEKSYRTAMGGREGCLGERTLASTESVKAREATVEPEPRKEAVERAREVADLLDRFVDFLLITCVCGVRIKVPPGFPRDSIRCTRCGKTHAIPRAEVAAAARVATAAVAGAAVATAAPLRYRRRGTGWESFKCDCGRVQQLSPAISVSRMTCRKCGREIEIERD
jgi:heat shock protein HtpX